MASARAGARRARKRTYRTITFHDIRGSAVTRLAEAGGEVPEIATITGHSLADVEAILDARYLGRTTKLAVSAVAKLERAAAVTRIDDKQNWKTFKPFQTRLGISD